jgi:hypothetical protein
MLHDLRDLHAIAHSRLPTKINAKGNKTPIFTKFEDGSWIIYTSEADIFHQLYMEYQSNPEFRDICLRGADVEDVCYAPKGFPPDAVTDKRVPYFAMLWFNNPNPKCARCWKRYPEVNDDELCTRCDGFVPADHPARGNRK